MAGGSETGCSVTTTSAATRVTSTRLVRVRAWWSEADRTSVRLPVAARRSASSPARTRSDERSCAAGGGGDCERRPGRPVGRWRTRNDIRRCQECPVPIRPVEDRYTTGAPVESGRHLDRGGRRRHDLESNRSSRETGATLGATCLQHGTPTASTHAGAEAVCLGTTAGIWLKGTLHGISGSSGDTTARVSGTTTTGRADRTRRRFNLPG